MKYLLLATTAIALLCLSFVRAKRFVPPGTVQINDTLFADEAEVSNIAWQEYELAMKTQYGINSIEHKATLPDTLVWRQSLSHNEPYVLYYYRHPAYREFPVVGITYEQAVAYCIWRTERVRTFLFGKKDFKDQNFEYRLPCKTEWEALAQGCSDVIDNKGKDKKGKCIINCVNPLPNGDCMHTDHADVTVPVREFPKNMFGLYNIAGNVSEMVMEKGICKGGGWKNALADCRPTIDAYYTSPTAWIGFRCVCVVKKNL